MPSSHSGRRGPRKQYSVPNKSFSLFTVTAGDSSGAVDACPRNTSGQRVSDAGLGEGPLEGGPRDADGFLMKVEDDDLKIVIYQQMDLADRQFAIAFMAQDKPAPPGKPNACLSKYERAIIATYNDITTADFNGDTHWRELIERASAKGPVPQRLPKNPLVLPGVGAGKGKAGSAPASSLAPKSEPQGFQGNTTIERLAALEGGAVQNASSVNGNDDNKGIAEDTTTSQPLTMGQIRQLEIPVDVTKMDEYRKLPTKGIDLSSRWTTYDFIVHYYSGKGQLVDLRWIGLGERYQNAPSVIALSEKFIVDTYSQAKEGFTAERARKNNVKDEGPLFSVGGHWFSMKLECDANRCLYHFSIRDAFQDPLDSGFEVLGKPYHINYDFYRAFKLPPKAEHLKVEEKIGKGEQADQDAAPTGSVEK